MPLELKYYLGVSQIQETTSIPESFLTRRYSAVHKTTLAQIGRHVIMHGHMNLWENKHSLQKIVNICVL